ncbi:MAG: hypothetical protein ABJA75_22025 [Bradyrhizobium sp.]
MERPYQKDTCINVVRLFSEARVDAGLCSKEGTRRLAGLSFEEAIKFDVLDASPPFDDNGNLGWSFEGKPTTRREKRWLALYKKHDRALRAIRRSLTPIDGSARPLKAGFVTPASAHNRLEGNRR